MNIENEKVFSVVKEALKHFPSEWVIVSLNDGMIDVEVELPSHKIPFLKAVARYEKCDVVELTEMLERMGVHSHIPSNQKRMDYTTFESKAKVLVENYNKQLAHATLAIKKDVEHGNVYVLTMQNTTSPISASLPVRAIYKLHCDSNKTVEQCLLAAVNFLAEQLREKSVDLLFAVDSNKVRNNIIPSLINADKYKDEIEEIPHRDFCDMTVIYRLELPCSESGVKAFHTVDNAIMKRLNLNEDGLFQLAKSNMAKRFPPKFGLMHNITKDFCETCEDISDEGFDDLDNFLVENENYTPNRVWYLSNTGAVFGASTLLYEEVLQKIAEKAECNLLLAPMSIHMFAVVPDNEWYPMEFAKRMQSLTQKPQKKTLRRKC